MTKDGEITHPLILALDVRARKTGFAVFAGTRLLDWGIVTYGKNSAQAGIMASRRFAGLLDLHEPALVVMRQRRAASAVSDKALFAVMRRVQQEVQRSTEFRILAAQTVKQFYRLHGCRNKQQIASALATWYPELAWKLPGKRKIWKAEDHHMTLFDAAAAGLCFLNGVEAPGSS